MGAYHGVFGNAFDLILAGDEMPNIIDCPCDQSLAKAVITFRFEMMNLRKAKMVIFKRILMTIGLVLTTAMAFAYAKTHKIVFHVD